MDLAERIPQGWADILSGEFSKPYFSKLSSFVDAAYASETVYPSRNRIFRALEKTAWNDVRVVIIGQDPYHGPGQADGLCFSVQEGVAFPPSLRNIFKELKNNLGIDAPFFGNLDRWAEQGVFLLNATLTVKANEAGSHQNQGWEEFTDAVIDSLRERSGLVYILWGNFAQKKAGKIDEEKNLVLKSAHPSPLSAHRGFFGNEQFSKVNTYLADQGKPTIIW